MEDKKSVDGWQKLTCSCGTIRFAKVLHLRWRAGSGVTEEPNGYFCLECQAPVDAAQLITKLQLKMKQQELRDLESDIGQIEPPQRKAVAAK
jgi:hypothetical protein